MIDDHGLRLTDPPGSSKSSSARSALRCAAAAIANAVYHATGVRVRKLPIKIEHLLA
jgi:hypothetical protein